MAEQSRRSKASPQKKEVPEFLRKHIMKNREKERREDEAYLKFMKRKKAKALIFHRNTIELVKVRGKMRDYTLKIKHVKSEMDRVRNHLQIVRALKAAAAHRNRPTVDVTVVIRTTSSPFLTYSGAIVTTHQNSSQLPTFNSIENNAVSANAVVDLRRTSYHSTVFENALICCAEIPADSDYPLPAPMRRMADRALVSSPQTSSNTVLTTAVAQLISSTGMNKERTNYQGYDSEMNSTLGFSDEVMGVRRLSQPGEHIASVFAGLMDYNLQSDDDTHSWSTQNPTMQLNTQVNYPRPDFNFEKKIKEIMLSSP